MIVNFQQVENCGKPHKPAPVFGALGLSIAAHIHGARSPSAATPSPAGLNHGAKPNANKSNTPPARMRMAIRPHRGQIQEKPYKSILSASNFVDDKLHVRNEKSAHGAR